MKLSEKGISSTIDALSLNRHFSVTDAREATIFLKHLDLNVEDFEKGGDTLLVKRELIGRIFGVVGYASGVAKMINKKEYDELNLLYRDLLDVLAEQSEEPQMCSEG